jgi:hypothetical protein
MAWPHCRWTALYARHFELRLNSCHERDVDRLERRYQPFALPTRALLAHVEVEVISVRLVVVGA